MKLSILQYRSVKMVKGITCISQFLKCSFCVLCRLTLISGIGILVSGFLSSIRETRFFSPSLIAGLRYHRNTEQIAEVIKQNQNIWLYGWTMTACFYKRWDTTDRETLFQIYTDCQTASVTIKKAEELSWTKQKKKKRRGGWTEIVNLQKLVSQKLT